MPLTLQNALKTGSLREIRKVPKSDLHNHSMLGGSRSRLEKILGIPVGRFRYSGGGIRDINDWIARQYRPVMDHPEALEKTLEAAFFQAGSDGITVLEMSMDVFFGILFGISPDTIISTLDRIHREKAPGIDFRPELGLSRSLAVRTLLRALEPYLASGYFRSADLYDDEFAQPVENFREIYRFLKQAGLKCKAHAGEFGDAESVRKTAELLGLDAVQHGIAAAGSPDVMKWLAASRIPLNVCPASNIRLRRARSYKTHPIRILYDHGVKVTVNTDDVVLFGAGVSEQFLKLYTSGLFSARELEMIRKNGLE
jgi:adenosine deaminase